MGYAGSFVPKQRTVTHNICCAVVVNIFIVFAIWQVVLFAFYVGLATCAENYSLTKIDELDDIFAHIRLNNIYIHRIERGAFTYFVHACIASCYTYICLTTKMLTNDVAISSLDKSISLKKTELAYAHIIVG